MLGSVYLRLSRCYNSSLKVSFHRRISNSVICSRSYNLSNYRPLLNARSVASRLNISPFSPKRSIANSKLFNYDNSCTWTLSNATVLRSFCSQPQNSSDDDGNTNNKGKQEDEILESEEDGDMVPVVSPIQMLMPESVPKTWPKVPVIAINRNPLFPSFIKFVSVRILTLIQIMV